MTKEEVIEGLFNIYRGNLEEEEAVVIKGAIKYILQEKDKINLPTYNPFGTAPIPRTPNPPYNPTIVGPTATFADTISSVRNAIPPEKPKTSEVRTLNY
jgi:hypothetical protein